MRWSNIKYGWALKYTWSCRSVIVRSPTSRPACRNTLTLPSHSYILSTNSIDQYALDTRGLHARGFRPEAVRPNGYEADDASRREVKPTYMYTRH